MCTEMPKNCMVGEFQKLPIDFFEWRKKKFTFDEKFIRNYDDGNDKR